MLGQRLIRENEHKEFYFKPEKNPSKLTNAEIKEYLSSYGQTGQNTRLDFGIPELIASPLNQKENDLEFKSSDTGDLIYSGIISDSPWSDERVRQDLWNPNGELHYQDRKVNIDTYFNKVLTEAVSRKIIKLGDGYEEFLLGDLCSLRLSYAFKKDTIQSRETNEKIRAYQDFARQSKESNIVVC